MSHHGEKLLFVGGGTQVHRRELYGDVGATFTQVASGRGTAHRSFKWL